MHKLTVYDNAKKFILEFEGTPTVQEVLTKNGIIMPHPCGGKGVCGKCVIEALGALSNPDEKELALDLRLSCRTRLHGDATVILQSDTSLQTTISDSQIEGSSDEGCPEIGAVVDIGTTTVALAIYDLQTGICLATRSALNPQSTIAADVIGRIDYAMNGHLQELSDSIRTCIDNLALATGYKDKIGKWVMTGNTTMLYLLMALDPTALSAFPFEADMLLGTTTVFNGKPLYLPPCMHSFVGADTTCAVLDSKMCDSDETVLLCDVGTNGEIALWKKGTLYVTSTAAGPAFEGAGISHGCQSVAGAIERVTLVGDKLETQTIGGAYPVGLCGSGIIDAISCLLENGTIDETGAMEDDETVICGSITVTQKDVRAIQFAKAAIAAGIKTLLQITDTGEDEIAHFYIAGGFGSHLNIDSAIRIGLFPEKLRDKITIIGNAALKGATTMLTSKEQIEKATAIAAKATYVNLGGMAEFNKIYIEEMNFEEID